MQQQQPQGRHGQPQIASYGDFAGTHPPTFAKAEDPLEADSWIRLMESKFELLTCTETQKTLFSAHQLRGATASWCATFLAMQPVAPLLINPAQVRSSYLIRPWNLLALQTD